MNDDKKLFQGDEMVKFSIVLVTYDRHELLNYTLKSLALQTYHNFEIILIDNGSRKPVDTASFPSELDITFIRYEENDPGGSRVDDALKSVDGTHFVLLADDDVWIPRTLEIVAEIFNSNSNINSLGVGFSQYDLLKNKSLHDHKYFMSFSSALERYDAFKVGIGHCGIWGIGTKTDVRVPRMSHSSAAFYNMDLINRTIENQNELLVRPFGDVGFLGCCFYQQHLYYLDLPLVVIGASHKREMDGSLSGQRLKWQREVPFLEFSPLKGCSFINMGVESHLKVLYRHGINKRWDCTLRSDFFMQHLEQVVTDDPWTETTERDIEEAIPYAIAAFQRESNYKHNTREIAMELNKWIEKKRNKQKGDE